MIKLSTKGRYGTLLMLNLAQNYKNGTEVINLADVSRDEEISVRYLEQIIVPLKHRKLVKSVRGAGGGYCLARNPSSITLCEILETLEGIFSLVDCVEDPLFCHRIPICATYEVWKEASHRLKDYFEKLTLLDLIKVARKKNPKHKKMN